MRNGSEVINKILSVIGENKSFFITGHLRPDGDCVSSELALALFLKRIGKKVFVVNKDDIPYVYSFLPGIRSIKKVNKVNKKFDVGFFLDASNLKRTGDIIDLGKIKILINIDHHIDAANFGDYNLINPEASSTSELIYLLIKNSKYPIEKKEAICLYTGIVMDTGGFQHLNTTYRTHEIIADLLQTGVNPYYISQKLYKNKTASQLKLMGLSFSTLEIDSSGKIVFFKLTNKMYKQARSSSEETEGFIDYVNSIKGLDIIILFKETEKKNIIKISLRSRDKIDVNKIAKIFGGGGHRKAAGCVIKGTMQEAQEKVLKYSRKVLRDYGRNS